MGCRIAILITLAALFGGAAGDARANGRFPASVEVWPQPNRPDRFLVANTFGLLIATDGGATTRWICEEALGYGGTFDPDYEITADGTMYVATFDGLRVSRDDGCTWEPVVGPPLGGRFGGSIDLGPGEELFVVTSDLPPNEAFVSRDGGLTFESAGLVSETGTFQSIEVAPSNGDVIYVAGFDVPNALLFATRNGGDTWEPLPLDDFELPNAPILFVEAVSPTDPNVVFVRVRAGGSEGDDVLYRTIDGGQTWALVLDIDADIRDVLVRADGQTVIVATVGEGPRISSDLGDTFVETTDSLQMACVAETSDGGLLACAANYEPDRSAVSSSADGDRWAPGLRFERIDGPLKCPVETVQFSICESTVWPGLAEQLGVGTLDNPADAGPSEPDAGPTEPPEPQPRSDGGCCSVTARSSAAAAVVLALLVVVLVQRRPRAR